MRWKALDFIPVIGHLDDLVILPLLVITAVKVIPPLVMKTVGQGRGPRKVREGEMAPRTLAGFRTSGYAAGVMGDGGNAE